MTDESTRGSARGHPLSVLVPVRNYASGMQQFLDGWHKAISATTNQSFEFIVIDDASTDSTKSIVENFAKRHNEVHLLQHEQSQGVGAALRTGFAACQHALVLIVHPNWPYRPGDLTMLAEAMKEADIVAPYRPSEVRPIWLSRFGGLMRFIARWVFGIDYGPPAAWYGGPDWWTRVKYRWRFGLRLQDPSCGLRLMRRWVLDCCPIQSNGPFALVETYAKANFAGALIHEVPLGGRSQIPVVTEVNSESRGEQKVVFRSPLFHPKTTAGIAPHS